jgi:FAD/FMN-containing dehydrogenase
LGPALVGHPLRDLHRSLEALEQSSLILAELLRETEEHHGQYEKTHVVHHWWDWYAPYLSARQNGSSPEEAAAAADRYMAEVKHIAVSLT